MSVIDSAARVRSALDVARRSGGVDGEHHKAWTIDQMVRALTGCHMAEEGRVRAFLVEHDGHRIVWWSADYAYIDDKGALRGDYDDDLIQDGIGQMPLFVGHDNGFVPVEQLQEEEERAQRDAGVRR